MNIMHDIKSRATRLGDVAAEHGWRRAASERLVPPIARRTHATPRQVKAVLGILFVALSLKFLLGTAVRYRRK